MSKTPVSILQEMMVKNGTVPNYELIHNGGGTHINTFTYQVTCYGLSATGTGRCKKDAKHEAAKKMLESIAKHRDLPQLPSSPVQSPIRTPLPAQIPASPKTPANVPFINAIGALQDLCAENNLQEPQYTNISDVGPPHARVFTVQCTVSTFKEEGVATTKKQAKHDAAKKMLDKIMDVISDPKSSNGMLVSLQNKETLRQEVMANEMAKARYPELIKSTTVKKANLGIKLSEYHVKFKMSFDESTRFAMIETLSSMISQLKKDMDTKDYNYPEYPLKATFLSFLTSLNIECNWTKLAVNGNELVMYSVQLNTSPEILEIAFGMTEDEAEARTMLQVMWTLTLMLK